MLDPCIKVIEEGLDKHESLIWIQTQVAQILGKLEFAASN